METEKRMDVIYKKHNRRFYEKRILILGAFDTKGEEYAFLRDEILSRGFSVLAVNTGILGDRAVEMLMKLIKTSKCKK